jgi:hypothetical protein
MEIDEVINIGKECCRKVLSGYKIKKYLFDIDSKNRHASKYCSLIDFKHNNENVIINVSSYLLNKKIIDEAFNSSTFHPGVEFFIGIVCICNVLERYDSLLDGNELIVKIEDINKILAYYKVNPTFYYIGDSPNLIDDGYPCIDTTNAKDGIWEYFYCQRGIKDNRKQFNNESKALITLIGFLLYNSDIEI